MCQSCHGKLSEGNHSPRTSSVSTVMSLLSLMPSGEERDDSKQLPKKRSRANRRSQKLVNMPSVLREVKPFLMEECMHIQSLLSSPPSPYPPPPQHTHTHTQYLDLWPPAFCPPPTCSPLPSTLSSILLVLLTSFLLPSPLPSSFPYLLPSSSPLFPSVFPGEGEGPECAGQWLPYVTHLKIQEMEEEVVCGL